MKGSVFGVLLAGALLFPASGSTLAAGKLGGASGMDRFQVSASDEAQGGAGGDEDEDRPTTQGGKVGGSMDRPARLGGKLGIGAGDE